MPLLTLRFNLRNVFKNSLFITCYHTTQEILLIGDSVKKIKTFVISIVLLLYCEVFQHHFVTLFACGNVQSKFDKRYISSNLIIDLTFLTLNDGLISSVFEVEDFRERCSSSTCSLHFKNDLCQQKVEFSTKNVPHKPILSFDDLPIPQTLLKI